MGKVIGIDLGTTNSVVAVMEGGEARLIPNEEGGRTTPSVVAFTKDGQRLVGQIAKRQAITNPENTVFSIKRFMGRRYGEVSEEIRLVPFKVGRGQNDLVVVEVQGRSYTPPEISAMVLQKLKSAAEAYLGEEVKQDDNDGKGSQGQLWYEQRQIQHSLLFFLRKQFLANQL